jgi:hypothetical protein
MANVIQEKYIEKKSIPEIELSFFGVRKEGGDEIEEPKPIPTEDEITKLLLDLDNDVKVKMQYNPLFLLTECTSNSCNMNREKYPFRNFVENILYWKIQGVNSICSIGPGYLFQDYIYLREKDCSDLTFIMIENMRDYIQTVTNGENGIVDPLKYYGKYDEMAKSRALWAYCYTMRFISFMSVLNFKKIVLCEDKDSYKKAISFYTTPKLILAMDIMDDYAQFTVPLFYDCAKMTEGCKAISVSDGLLCAFDVRNGEEENVIAYNYNSMMTGPPLGYTYCLYKLAFSMLSKRCKVILTLGTVLTIGLTSFFLQKLF